MHLYTLPDRLVAYFIYLITHQHKIIGFVTLHSQLGVCSIFKSVITNIPRMTGGEEKVSYVHCVIAFACSSVA